MTPGPVPAPPMTKCRHDAARLVMIPGLCAGMTYDEIAEKDPEEFAMRKKNKLGYRYPRSLVAPTLALPPHLASPRGPLHLPHRP